jgi:PII-like signaling protein
MSLRGEQVLLRAYLQSADRAPHTPTFERLLQAARKAGLAGATVLHGILGYGSHGLIRRSAWSIVGHVPVIVEIVDAGERIVSFVEGPLVELMVHGMVTLERANVMLYRDRRHDQPEKLTLGGLLAPLSTLPDVAARAHVAERGRMKVNEHGVLLRIFVGESDRFANQRLYDAIVAKARELGLAGATVLRGTEGFGAHSVVHRTSLLEMSTDLPIVIEIVDSEEQIKRLLPHLEEMVQEGMITMEYVVIILYRDGAPEAAAT